MKYLLVHQNNLNPTWWLQGLCVNKHYTIVLLLKKLNFTWSHKKAKLPNEETGILF